MNKIVLTITFLLVAFFVQAGPLWMRYPKISPDGKQIAFSYKGKAIPTRSIFPV